MKVKHLTKLMLLGITVLWLSLLAIPAGAQVKIELGIKLPPPIVFSAPPQVVVLPGTYVYVAPDTEEDIFFFDGYWWRPWQGHWYRSQHYDRGWGYYSREPTFYRDVHEDWRHEYHEHRWGGQPWHAERMPHQRAEKNWNIWKKDKYFERHQSWGVQGYKPRPQPQHHENYQHHEQRPEPQHHGDYQHQQQRPEPQHHGDYQHPQQRPEPQHHGDNQQPQQRPQPQPHGNNQQPQQRPEPQHHGDNQQPQGHEKQKNQPPGHTQPSQEHQTQNPQPNNQQQQHEGKGGKEDGKRQEKH